MKTNTVTVEHYYQLIKFDHLIIKNSEHFNDMLNNLVNILRNP